jgi:hypothetical protein
MTNLVTTELFRPVGPEELALLKQTGFKRWPPRLPGQPIFYPVTNEKYAAEIAEKWNVKDSGYGAVTRFFVQPLSCRGMKSSKLARLITPNGGYLPANLKN